jgi:TolB-like protein/DNA-binding winged helix-turn-helix (wHTH) protein/Flp pilus assembly protein TadD
MRDALELHAVRSSPEVTLPVRFAGLVVSLEACTLARDSGDAIPLTRGEFALLRMFVTRPGRVISRDTLLDAFTNRRFEPFDRSIDVLVGRLRKKVETDPKAPRLIVTVPGGGYRFDGLTQSLSSYQKPSIALQASPDDSGRPNERHGSEPPFAERSATTGEPGGAKMAISDCGGAPRLSIVVLPFANFGGDPEQDYFVDGVTDSLTTDLSRIRGAFVIGRSTAFTYKGKGADVRQIGRDLNVRYVLEGSVQRGGNRMRVNVQLLEAETASHIWAERFDKPVADLFDMQDEIVSRLANGLGQELARAEASRAKRSATPDSMDHFFLGYSQMNGGQTADAHAKARLHFDRALELDPDNVDALVGRAWADLAFVMNWLSEDRRARLLSAEAYLAKALQLSPDCAAAHCASGALRIYSNRAVQGIAECERSLAIDRNLAFAHALIGMGKVLLGRNEETEAHILEALRISPRDALAWIWMGLAGTAKIHLGRDEEALAWLNRAIEFKPNSPVTQFCLAATLAHLDRAEEAREAAHACLKLNPSFTIARFRSQPYSDNPVYLAGRERIYEGLHKAGIPEG